MEKAGKLRGREGACGRPGGLRAEAAPPPARAVSALGGAGAAGTREPGSGPPCGSGAGTRGPRAVKGRGGRGDRRAGAAAGRRGREELSSFPLRTALSN